VSLLHTCILVSRTKSQFPGQKLPQSCRLLYCMLTPVIGDAVHDRAKHRVRLLTLLRFLHGATSRIALSWAILFDATNLCSKLFAAAKIDLVNIEYVLRAHGFQQLTEEPGDRKFVRRIRLTGSPTDCGPVYPPCTSLGRIRCFGV